MPLPDGQLTYVPPEHIGHWWPRVKPVLERLYGKIQDRCKPEDIYTAIVTGRATLHIASKVGMPEGFIVAEPVYATYGNTLNIWIAAGFNGTADIAAYQKGFDELARAIKADRVRFSSPRPGWASRITKIGFRPVTTVYEREVL